MDQSADFTKNENLDVDVFQVVSCSYPMLDLRNSPFRQTILKQRLHVFRGYPTLTFIWQQFWTSYWLERKTISMFTLTNTTTISENKDQWKLNTATIPKYSRNQTKSRTISVQQRIWENTSSTVRTYDTASGKVHQSLRKIRKHQSLQIRNFTPQATSQTKIPTSHTQIR